MINLQQLQNYTEPEECMPPPPTTSAPTTAPTTASPTTTTVTTTDEPGPSPTNSPSINNNSYRLLFPPL